MTDPIERINNATTVKELVDLLRDEARFFSKDKHDWYECMFGDMAVLYNAFADRLSILSEPNGCNSPTYHARPPVCNAAAMRGALVKSLDALKSLSRTHGGDLPEDVRAVLGRMAFDVNAALSASARNCDVGDAADWEKRFGEECDKGHICSDCPVRHEKTRMAIELDKGARCEFVWAQMPYDGGSDGRPREQ